MNRKIGIIGFGNIGMALVKGLIRNDLSLRNDICVYLRSTDNPKKLLKGIPVGSSNNLQDVVTQSGIVFLCVKSTQLKELVPALASCLHKRKKKIFVSMCSGVPLPALEQLASDNIAFVKAIANINIQAGAGLIIVYSSWEAAKKRAIYYLRKTGMVIEARTEQECDRLSTFAATLPAFIATGLSAMIDAGLYMGITKELSTFITAQVMGGTAKTIKMLQLHPEIYRQQVTSPGGVVIKGLRVLEKHKLRSAFIEAFSVIEEAIARKKT